MSDPVRIDFVALGPLSAQTPFQPAAKRGKNKAPLTLVLLAGQDLVFGSATRKLIGAEGEAFLKKAAAAGKFKGKTSSVLEIIAPSGFSADRLLIVGMGPVKEDKAKTEKDKAKDASGAKPLCTPESAASWSEYTNLGGLILSKLGTGAVALVAFDPPRPPADQAAAAADLLLGMRLRDYRFDLYKTKKKESEESGATDIYIAVDEPSAARREAKLREAVSDGVLTARSLVNEPANILYPEEFAKRAQALEKLGVEITILDEPAMQNLGMGALLGVGQGSVRESRVVIMRWRGTGTKGGKDSGKSKPIAFIGKGVCFDTGGISIKGAAGMEDMKGDMAGAACVVGLMQALASRKAKVDVIGAIGLVENMPGAEAQRPGDIVKSMSGQTIEVINTDAEGRLVLADVLWYVQDKYKPKFMIDLATLTGAILVALGQEYAGLFSNSDELCEKLTHVGQETGEKLWRMPLGSAYDKMIDSKFADMKNTGGRHGGSITAAQFLQRFVNDTPWAHLDIAGTGMNSLSTDINQSWGSGWGVRLLDRLVAEYYEG